MRFSKKTVFFFIIVLSLAILLPAQNDLKKRIQELDALLDDSLSTWKLNIQDVAGSEKITLDDSKWPRIRLGTNVRNKVFWLRHQFQTPENFAGVHTQGSDISLSCMFRGLGVFEGQFFLNGEIKDTFTLEFGNQSRQINKYFIISSRAKSGEKIFLAFRFKNMGRLPLIKKKGTESGTFFRLQEAHFRVKQAQDSHKMLSRFLLDLKIGAMLVDILPLSIDRRKGERPVSSLYQKDSSSKEFKQLKEKFEKALIEFDIEALHQGDLSKVKNSLIKFYEEAKPFTQFLDNYTLHVAGNSHIDLAWLWRWRESVEVAKETFSTILDNMEEYPGIVFIQSQAQAYQWVEDYYPDVFARIKKKVKEGRWEIVGGMWAEPDCNLIDGESFIRQILYGKRYFQQKFGVDIKIGWNPDSFGYNWNMPQFFKKSGIDSFITQKISWNDTTVFPYFLFWWEGVDGSRVLTYFPPTGYVGRLRAERMVNGLKRFEMNTGLREALILYGLGNHGGGPNREMLDRLKGYENQNMFPKIKHTTVGQYLNQVMKRQPDLPVWNDELYLEYHRGTYTTQAETKKFNRKSEVLLANTEKISSLAYLFGKSYKSEPIQKAWQTVLMNQFHDILPGSSITPVYRDARGSYLEAHRDLKKILRENLIHLVQKIDTAKGEEGQPLLLFNTLSWPRDGVVKVKLPVSIEGEISVWNIRGEEVLSQVISAKEGDMLWFVAKNIPSLGYKVFKIKKVKASAQAVSLKAENFSLENRYFSVHLHPETGNIISIFDKKEKREVLSPDACGNELQLFEDLPDQWDAWNIGYTGRSWNLDKAESIKIHHQGPVMASLEVKKSFLGLTKARRGPTEDFPSSFFTQEIILYEDLPRIDIRMTADWWEEHVLLKVSFPVDIRNDKATYEIPFASVQRPTTRNTDWEKARFEVPAIRWADLSDGAYGVSLLNESKYGYDIKDNALRLTLLRSPTWPDPVADRGMHHLSYALYPHQGDWRDGDTVQKGYEFNVPLIALFTDSHSGELPLAYSFLKASPSNIILSAVKKSEDRQSLILRLYEAEGLPTQARIDIFRQPKKIFELDLMENRLRSLPVKSDALSLEFGKSEIKTIELVFD